MVGITSVEKLLFGHRIRLPLKGHPFREVFFNENYWMDDEEAAYLKRIVNHIRDADTVFDIGAFRGQFTIAMALKTGTDGKVISVEPNPASFALLQRTVQLNQDSLGHVELVNVALSDEEGTAQLTPKQAGSTLAPSASISQGVSVQVTTLDTLARTNGSVPQLIKMDVEGFEYKVLSGGEDVFRQCKWVCCEVHPRKMEVASGHRESDLYTLLEKLGYTRVAKFEPEKHLQDPGKPYQTIFRRG